MHELNASLLFVAILSSTWISNTFPSAGGKSEHGRLSWTDWRDLFSSSKCLFSFENSCQSTVNYQHNSIDASVTPDPHWTTVHPIKFNLQSLNSSPKKADMQISIESATSPKNGILFHVKMYQKRVRLEHSKSPKEGIQEKVTSL